MRPEETEFWLYLSHQSEQAVQNFARKLEQQQNSRNIEINRVDPNDAFFNKERLQATQNNSGNTASVVVDCRG